MRSAPGRGRAGRPAASGLRTRSQPRGRRGASPRRPLGRSWTRSAPRPRLARLWPVTGPRALWACRFTRQMAAACLPCVPSRTRSAMAAWLTWHQPARPFATRTRCSGARRPPASCHPRACSSGASTRRTSRGQSSCCRRASPSESNSPSRASRGKQLRRRRQRPPVEPTTLRQPAAAAGAAQTPRLNRARLAICGALPPSRASKPMAAPGPGPSRPPRPRRRHRRHRRPHGGRCRPRPSRRTAGRPRRLATPGTRPLVATGHRAAEQPARRARARSARCRPGTSPIATRAAGRHGGQLTVERHGGRRAALQPGRGGSRSTVAPAGGPTGWTRLPGRVLPGGRRGVPTVRSGARTRLPRCCPDWQLMRALLTGPRPRRTALPRG